MVKISVTAETPEEAARALQELYRPDASSSERLVSRESELERLLTDLVKEMSDGIQNGRATDEQFKVFPSVASTAAYLVANRP